MVKIILTILLFVGSTSAALAQSFPPDSVRRMLKHFLVDIGEPQFSESYSKYSLDVRNLLADQEFEQILRSDPRSPDVRYFLYNGDTEATVPRYGIYGFSGDSVHPKEHVFIKHDDEYIIIQMDIPWGAWSYMDVLLQLIDYFKDYPDANEWLMPIYNEAIIRVWDENLNVPFNGYYNWDSDPLE